MPVSDEEHGWPAVAGMLPPHAHSTRHPRDRCRADRDLCGRRRRAAGVHHRFLRSRRGCGGDRLRLHRRGGRRRAASPPRKPGDGRGRGPAHRRVRPVELPVRARVRRRLRPYARSPDYRGHTGDGGLRPRGSPVRRLVPVRGGDGRGGQSARARDRHHRLHRGRPQGWRGGPRVRGLPRGPAGRGDTRPGALPRTGENLRCRPGLPGG